jgi:hypothetical protein
MKSKKNMRKNKNVKHNKNIRNKNKKTLRGGFFFSKKVIPNEVCDITKVTDSSSSNELHQRYQTCCPKTFFGYKNSSPLCKTIDTKFQQALDRENMENTGVAGDESMSEEEVSLLQNQPVPQPQLPKIVTDVYAKKPWYQFWGGKTKRNKRITKKNKKSKRKY